MTVARTREPIAAAEAALLIQVFAKAPVPGQVKTRLAATLGACGAAELHRRLLRRTLAETARARLGGVELWTTPGADRDPRAGIDGAGRIAVRMQPDGDLGVRMGAALADGHRRARNVLLIGVDVPQMGAEDLLAARDALAAGSDAVLGPAEDGGYWLIGLSRTAVGARRAGEVMAALFEAVPWGTCEVLALTRARLHSIGLRWHELPPRSDVDRPEDLRRLAHRPDGAALLADLPRGT
jgi:hypothetical protein